MSAIQRAGRGAARAGTITPRPTPAVTGDTPMPRTKPPRHVANAIKDQGTSKRRTKEIADHTGATSRRRSARDTETSQGGSGDRRNARGPHRSNWGGVKADERGERGPRPGQKRDARSGPTKAPSRSRAGSASPGRQRTGGTGTNTRRAK